MPVANLAARCVSGPFQSACEYIASYLDPEAWYPDLRPSSPGASGYATPPEIPVDSYEASRLDRVELEHLVASHAAELASRKLQRVALETERDLALQWRDRAAAGTVMAFMGCGMAFGLIAQPFMLLLAVPLAAFASAATAYSLSKTQHYGRTAEVLDRRIQALGGEISGLRRHIEQVDQALRRVRLRLNAVASPSLSRPL